MTEKYYKVVRYFDTYPEKVIESNVEYKYAKKWQVYLMSEIKNLM